MEEKRNSNENYRSKLREELCIMCLSNDRHLELLEVCKKKFDMCDSLFTSVHFDLYKDKICWECRAHIAHIAAFKTKVFKAQEIFSALDNLRKKGIVIHKLTNLAKSETKIVTFSSKDSNNHPVSEKNHENVEIKQENFEEDNEPLIVVVKKENCDDDITDFLFDDERNDLVDEHDSLNTSKMVTAKFHQEKIDEGTSENDNLATETQIDVEDDEDLIGVSIIKTITSQDLHKYRDEKKGLKKFQKATYKCVDCILIFDSQPELDDHAAQHAKVNGDFSCTICSLRFPHKGLLEKHTAGHYNSYQCRVCRYECPGRLEFRRHCSRNHRPQKCEICDLNFKTVSQARYHKIKVHNNKRKNRTCQICSKQFSSYNSLQHHMLTHDGMPMLECDICHKKYRGKNGLLAHSRTHIKEPSEEAYCVECGVQYKNKYLYRAHLKHNSRHITSKERKYKCPECGKGFTLPHYLRNHINTAHTKNYLHFCQECGKGFYIKKTLKKHIMRIHEGKEPPRDKLCGVCGKAFKTKKVLEEHMNTHTGARPYVCAMCPATFAFSGALHTHTRLTHYKLKRPAKKFANKSQR